MNLFLLARTCTVFFLMPLSVLAATANPAAVLPGLVYHPEGDAIVVRNGTRWDNRPLYCNARQRFVMAGEMPGLSGVMGTLNVGIVRGLDVQANSPSHTARKPAAWARQCRSGPKSAVLESASNP